MEASDETLAARWKQELKAERWDEAVALLDAAIAEIEGGSARYLVPLHQLYHSKCLTYARAGRVKSSIHACLKAVRLAPERGNYWESLGKLLRSVEREALAQKCFAQARQRQGHDADGS